MYRELETPDALADRKELTIVKTLIDDVSGTKIHIGQAANYYEILLEPPQPGPMPATNVTKIGPEIFKALRDLPIPKE